MLRFVCWACGRTAMVKKVEYSKETTSWIDGIENGSLVIYDREDTDWPSTYHCCDCGETVEGITSDQELIAFIEKGCPHA